MVMIKHYLSAYFKITWKLYLCTHFLNYNICKLLFVDLIQLHNLHVALNIIFKEIILKHKYAFFKLLIFHTSTDTLFLFFLLSADSTAPTYRDRLKTFFPFTMTTPS